MIAKDIDPLPADADKFMRSGHNAEKQIAHYLDRAFSRDQHVMVFNGIRLADGDDAAQVDHLILHRFGFVLIESKSVRESVEINAHGEWTRWYAGKPQGMRSPVKQVELQRDFFRNFLNDHAHLMLAKLAGVVQCRFGGRDWQTIVAISDDGRISPKSEEFRPANVLKAEAVVDRVKEIIGPQGAIAALAGAFSREHVPFLPGEMEAVKDFLLGSHRPLHGTADKGETTMAAVPPRTSVVVSAEAEEKWDQLLAVKPEPEISLTKEAPVSRAKCGSCGSRDVDVAYAYTYFVKCQRCAANTKIDEKCPTCGKPMRIHKKGPEYRLECKDCGAVELYHRAALTV